MNSLALFLVDKCGCHCPYTVEKYTTEKFNVCFDFRCILEPGVDIASEPAPSASAIHYKTHEDFTSSLIGTGTVEVNEFAVNSIACIELPVFAGLTGIFDCLLTVVLTDALNSIIQIPFRLHVR